MSEIFYKNVQDVINFKASRYETGDGSQSEDRVREVGLLKVVVDDLGFTRM